MLNTRPFAHVARIAGLLALAAGAAAAHAGGGVYWSVNVDAPMQGVGRVGTTVSNAPYGAPYGMVVAAPQVIMPAPVVVGHPRVVYAPPPAVVYGPPVRYLEPVRYIQPGWGYHHHHHHHGHGGWRGHHGR